MTGAAAIAWEFRQRHRWGVLALGVYFVLLAAFKGYVLARGVALDFNDAATFALMIPVPMAIIFIYALAVFTYGLSGDLAARQSMYPARMFTLPVSNAGLAGWPMFFGSATIAVLWMLTRLFVIWPTEFRAPYVWPVTLGAALVMWTQAFVWMPYGLRGVRVIFAVLWLMIIDSVVLIEVYVKAPEWVIIAITAPLIPLAYAAGLYAVTRARQGAVPDWSHTIRSTLGALSGASSVKPQARFSSAEQAQAWFEWRRHGLALPFIVVILLPFELLVLKVAGNTGLVLIIIGTALITPPFMAAFVAASVGSAERGTRDAYGLSPFMATRPLTSAALIAAKLKMTAWSTLLTWIMVLIAIPLGVRWTGATPAVIQRWHGIVAFMGEARAIFLVAAIVVLCALTTWRQLVQTMYIGLTGRDWVVKGYVALTLLAVSALGPVLDWIVRNDALLRLIWNATPFLLGVLATAKVALAVWVVLRVSRSRLVQDRTLLAGVAVWCAVVLAVHGALLWFFESEYFPHYVSAFAAILIVPLARLSASPLALAWNRHR